MRHSVIVIFVDHGIGDLLMAVPLLRNCSATHGVKDRMIIIVKTEYEVEVVNSIHLGGNIEVYKSGYYSWRRYIKLIKVALYLRIIRPDILLVPMFADKLQNVLLIRMIGARISVGPYGKWGRLAFNRCVEKTPKAHKAERFFQTGIIAGIKQMSKLSKKDMILPISPTLINEARKIMPGWAPDQIFIALAPGSGPIETHKRWPINGFQELVRELLVYSQEIRIVAFGSHKEQELLASILENTKCDKGRCFVYAGTQFDLSIAFLSQCRCLVGSCSGPAHMAAAAGIPIVGIFGPTNPWFTGPYSKHLHIVRAGIECSPCYRNGFISGCGDPICMSLIDPNVVFEKVLMSLDGLSPQFK